MFNYSSATKWKDFLEIFKIFNLKNDEKIKQVWGKYNKDVVNYFSKSSWSMVLVVLLRLKKETLNLWVPSYYCEDALFLIKKLNIKINYYDVDQDFIANEQELLKLSKKNKPDIIIFCNFFGKNCFSPYLREISKKSNSWLIEDATHCISPENNIGKYGDFVIYSPYKFLPIPTGAILTTSSQFAKKNKLEILFNEKEQILLLKNNFNILNFKKNNNFIHNFTWVLKKILNKFNLNFKKIKNFVTDEKIQNSHYFWSPKLDYLSKNLLVNYAENIEIEKEKRLRMLLLWKKLILQFDETKNLDFDLSFISNKQTPYFAIIKDKENKIEEKYNNLKKKNLPILTWPNLPEDIPKNSLSLELRKNFFYLPLHDQTFKILKSLKNTKQIVSNNSFKDIFLNKIEKKEEWEKYFKKVSFSNIIQSWDYAESQKQKYDISITRYLISADNLPKGIVQVSSKKFLFFKYNRINRGPLFFEKVTDDYKRKVFVILLNKFNNYRRLNFLTFLPEVNFNENNILLSFENKNIYFNLPDWKSSRINLEMSENYIMSQLDSKWRNMLNFAFKEQIKVKEEYGEKELKRIISLNVQDQINKDYKGINDKILYNYLSNSNFKILSAYYNQELIASICFSLHGTTATYLIGWSNEIGRSKKSMNLLLWNAVIYLKKMKFKFFDLGGVDKTVSPGIYRFKNGMGGESYKLVGNYHFYSDFKLF